MDTQLSLVERPVRAAAAGATSGRPTPAGPDARFDEEYERHREGLLRWLRLRMHDDAAAEDVCQEAYARLLCQLRSGSPPDSVAAWLHRVALNLVIHGARRDKVAQARAPRLREADGADLTADLALARERLAAVGRSLGRIPDHQPPVLAQRPRRRCRAPSSPSAWSASALAVW